MNKSCCFDCVNDYSLYVVYIIHMTVLILFNQMCKLSGMGYGHLLEEQNSL